LKAMSRGLLQGAEVQKTVGISVTTAPPPGVTAKLDGYVKYPAGLIGAPRVTVTAKLGEEVVKTVKTDFRGYFAMELTSNQTYNVQAARVLQTAVSPIYLPPEGVSTVLILKIGRLETVSLYG